MFLHSCLLFLCNIANVAQRTFEIVQKSRSHEHGNIINYIDKKVERTSTVRVHESRNIHVRGMVWRFKKIAADFVCDNGVVGVSLLHVWWWNFGLD